MRLVMIRHGVTPSNEHKRYIGTTDESLSDKGVHEIKKNISKGKYPDADLVAVSPMNRCKETAQLIYGVRNKIIIEAWKEIDFGDFEGKNYMELRNEPSYQTWIASNGALTFPNGEGRKEFATRCMDGFDVLIANWQRCQPLAETAVMVVHGGTIMAILSTLCQRDYFDFHCANGDGFVIDVQWSESPESSGMKQFQIMRVQLL